jgi:hypothetical protein
MSNELKTCILGSIGTTTTLQADIENDVMEVTTNLQKQLPPPTESRVTHQEESEIAFLTELVQVTFAAFISEHSTFMLCSG